MGTLRLMMLRTFMLQAAQKMALQTLRRQASSNQDNKTWSLNMQLRQGWYQGVRLASSIRNAPMNNSSKIEQETVPGRPHSSR